MANNLGFNDLQAALANFGGRAYAFGTIVEVEEFTPAPGQATLTVTTRMRPNQWQGAGLVVYGRGRSPFSHWWEIVSNTESEIVVQPDADHYVTSVLQEGDSFAICDLTTITSAIAAGGGQQQVVIAGRGGNFLEVADAQSIFGGVFQPLDTYSRFTVYISATGAVDIDVYMLANPNGPLFALPESPVSFAGAGDDVMVVEYQGLGIYFEGSNATPVTIQIVGVY